MAGIVHTARSLVRSVSGAVHRSLFPSGLEHYVHAVRQDASTRNPVVVLHGIMGGRLEEKDTGKVLWGGSDRTNFADPEKPEDLLAVSFPMLDPDVPISQREDETHATGSIHSFQATLAGLPLSVPAYGPILEMLGVGGFLKESDTRGGKDQLDYDHRSVANCFEFFYDWRRSVPDNAQRLKKFIENVLVFSRYDAKLPSDKTLKVDIVAHSMGGLLVRYLLRYGGEPMPTDGSLLDVTWEGAALIENAILVGTPSGGSIMGIEKLLGGLPPTPATPGYPAGLLTTFPAIFQLMPRSRHEMAIDQATGEPIEDLYDPELWARMQWGICDDAADDVRRALLPGIDSESDRKKISLEHVAACLAEARQFHEHLDRPARLPDHSALHLFAGDGVKTPRRLEVGPRGEQKVLEYELGDGTVRRASALMDERRTNKAYPRVLTPIHWSSVSFVPAPHMVLTRHPSFINNALYILLEKPRPGRSYAEGAITLEEILQNRAPKDTSEPANANGESEPREG